MFNDVLTLIAVKKTDYDSIGNPVKIETQRDILCDTRSVTRYEYFNYGTDERVPEIVATINACEYFGEKSCMFRGNRYAVIRTYEADRDLMELTLERVKAK